MRGAVVLAAALVLGGAAGCSSSGGSDAASSAPTTDAVAPASSAPASQPPLDGGSYASAGGIAAVLSGAGQECSPGNAPALSEFDGATDAAQCSSPGAASQDTTIVVFGNHDQAVAYAKDVVVAVADLPADTTAVLGANWALSTTSSSYGQAVQRALGGTIFAPQAAPSPTVAATQAPEQVTYHCEGHGAVNITYGPNGTQHSASSLPFTHTEALTTGAQYYVTEAQLQGGGQVTCTTTVQTDNLDGSADDVTNTGSADGGYNIASAQVCFGI